MLMMMNNNKLQFDKHVRTEAWSSTFLVFMCIILMIPITYKYNIYNNISKLNYLKI